MPNAGLAAGLAAAAQGIQSGFQYQQQQQQLEQERKQQELDRAEARADAKMRREQLMKEIEAKEKARAIYAKDPEKDFGIKKSDFLNQDLYEAELSTYFAAEFRKAGLGEEAMKHEMAGGQFHESGVKKAAKRAVGHALQGNTKQAVIDLKKLKFDVGDIERIKNKDGSISFNIVDYVGKDRKVLSTINAAELAAVYGDEDALMAYMLQKQTSIDKIHAELEAKLAQERRMKEEGLGIYDRTSAGVDSKIADAQREILLAASPFVTKSGLKTISSKDLEITKGLLERGHNLSSINKMRAASGLPEIELRTNISKDEKESLQNQYSGLVTMNESTAQQIEEGAAWYNRAKSSSDWQEPKPADGMGSQPKVEQQPTKSDWLSNRNANTELPSGWLSKEEFDRQQQQKENNESQSWKNKKRSGTNQNKKIDWSKTDWSQGGQIE